MNCSIVGRAVCSQKTDRPGSRQSVTARRVEHRSEPLDYTVENRSDAYSRDVQVHSLRDLFKRKALIIAQLEDQDISVPVFSADYFFQSLFYLINRDRLFCVTHRLPIKSAVSLVKRAPSPLVSNSSSNE